MQMRRLRWVVIVMVLTLAWGASVPGRIVPMQVARAQGTGLLFNLRVEVLFPAVVRFIGGVNAPANTIQTVSITVYQGAQFQQTFSFVPAEHVLADHGSSVELVYDWPLTDTPLPVPFDSVDYVWQVLTTTGQSDQFEGRFQFEDSAVGAWDTVSGGPVTLHWHNSALAGKMLQSDVMRAYTLLSGHVIAVPPFNMAIYEQNVSLCQTTQDDAGIERTVVFSQDGRSYACSAQAYKAVYAAAGISYLQRDGHGYAELQKTLITALVRSTYRALWRDKVIPAWFEVGLANLYHLQANTAALEVARAAGRTDSLLPLEALTFDPPDAWSLTERNLWNAESYLLVLYLADQFGADAPFELAQRIVGDPGSFESIFTAYTGRDLRLFWVEWERWLYAGAAHDAALWTPYLNATPAPTGG